MFGTSTTGADGVFNPRVYPNCLVVYIIILARNEFIMLFKFTSALDLFIY